MESALTKSQLCWIIVRVIGLQFLFGGIWWVIISVAGSGGWGELFAIVIFQGALVLLGSFYFLRRGIWIHRLLMFEYALPEAMIVLQKAPLDPETGMAAEELELFREWRDANPSINYLKIENQVARYRDSRSK